MRSVISPRSVVGPAVWKRRDFLGESSWIRVFTAAELSEVHGAMQTADTYNSDPNEFTASSDPLPVLEAAIGQVRSDLLTGRGFSVLRGLDVENYDSKTLDLLYRRLCAHLGEIAPQNAEGDLLRHVTDLGDVSGYDQDASLALGHRGHAKMFPHTDSADIAGLLCVRQAKKGGGNTVSSSMAIHNEILRRHPEYLSLLYEGFHFDLTGKGESVTDRRIPVFRLGPGGVCCLFNKSRIELGMRKCGMPLDDLQQSAVNYLNELAMLEEFAIPMHLLPGDILFLNNHCTLHAREEYEDWPEPHRKRLMLRLWLNVPGSHKSPNCLF